MDLTEEKDKEEPTRKRRETGHVLDPVRIAGKKRRNNDDGILEEDCKNVLLDDPTTTTVSDPVIESSAKNEVEQSGAQLPVLEEARLFTSSDMSTLFDGSVSSSLGSMRPLVEKLDKLLAPAQEYYRRLPKRIKEGMHLLKDDVEVISSYLDELSEVEDPPPMAMCWMNEARDLSYDMEDYIDSLLFVPPDRFIKKKKKKKKRKKKMMIKKRLKWYKQVAFTAQVSKHGIKTSKIIHVNGPRLPSKPKAAETIPEFRIYVQEAIERHDRYKLHCCRSTLSRTFLSSGIMLPAPYEEASQIVIDGRMNEFINSQSLVADDVSEQQQLKVVSVIGSGCLGKTTLAKVLYNRIGVQFDCRAFIQASKKPDMKTLFCDLFSQLHQKKQPLPANCNELDISDNTSKHLQDKRYLIIIDDLWDASVWDILKYAFPKGSHSSRIIITTQIEDVALRCCCDDLENVFEMKPLDDDHSRKLFFNRLFGSENDCPVEFKQVSNAIIDICGGLPLATINIASHLANQQTAVSLDSLTYICDSLRSHLWSGSTSERTRQVLNLSYNNLPRDLKTCLLYLHMYPEGSIIWKDDLVKQWVAEGYIATRKGEEQDQEMLEKAAGIYFDELIDRRFIQPFYINYNNKVLSCTVHDVVRDLIAHKSTEENFIVVVDCSRKNISLSHKVRRLSLVFGDAKYAKTPANITKSQIRSLRFFGLFECMPCIREFKVLRVLNLQLSGHCGDPDPADLTGISELFHLRYLKIKSDVWIKLPNQMRKLQYLETLDIMDAPRVTAIPWDIIYLPQLLHLTLPVDTNLLDWIRSMSDSSFSLWSLGKLHYLQDLLLTSSSTHPAHHLERCMEALGSLISGHGNLKNIVLAHGSSVKSTVIHGAPKVTISWDRMAPPPLLQRFECLPHSCIIFYRIPKWITELGNLCILKISVKELKMICVGILRELRALTALSLYVETAPLEQIIFDKPGFLVLKHFKLRSMRGIAWLKYEVDAMPNLQNLKLVFNAIPRMDQHLFISSNQAPFKAYQHGTAFISIEHMPGLKEISTKFGGAAADVEYALRIGVSNHPSNPTINVQFGDYTSYGDARTKQKQRPDEFDKSLEMATDKRIFSRSRESSSCLHIPGAVGDPKRMRTGGSSMSSSSLGGGGARSSVVETAPPATDVANTLALPVVVVDKEEARIQLVQALLTYVEAVQQENLSAVKALAKQIPLMVASQGGAMHKVTAYSRKARTHRVFRFHLQPDSSLLDAAFADLIHAHFHAQRFGSAAADVEYALRIGDINHLSNPTINVQLGDYSSCGDERTKQKQRPDEVLEEKPDEYEKLLEIPTDKRILSRSPVSSSCLHVPDAVGELKQMRTCSSSMSLSSPSSSSLGDATGNSALWMFLELLNNWDTQYSWGSAALAYLYRQRIPVGRPDFKNPLMANPRGNHDGLHDDDPYRHPTLAYYWEQVTVYTGSSHVRYKCYMNELDTLTAEQVYWLPYVEAAGWRGGDAVQVADVAFLTWSQRCQPPGAILAGAPHVTTIFLGFLPWVLVFSDVLHVRSLTASEVIAHRSGQNPRAAKACTVYGDARGCRYLLGGVCMTLTGSPP